MTASSAAPKPRGNPTLHLAPRCGARTRAGCPCRAPAIHGRARCRMHGGRSTGPRTPEGLARLRAARTLHGDHGAPALRDALHVRIILARVRVLCEATALRPWLPPALTARLEAGAATELGAPPDPAWGEPPYDGGAGSRAALRAAARAEAAALAPWRAAIAAAREARRAEWAQEAYAPEAGHGAPVLSACNAQEAHAPVAAISTRTLSARTAQEAHAPAPPAASSGDRAAGASLGGGWPRPEGPRNGRQEAHAPAAGIGTRILSAPTAQEAHAPAAAISTRTLSARMAQEAHAPEAPAASSGDCTAGASLGGELPRPEGPRNDRQDRPLNRKQRRRLKWLARQARRELPA
jgi:hypothetical protein